MRSLLCAIAFLTRVPVPQKLHTATADLGRSARYFPLVGLLLGAIYAGAATLLMRIFSPLTTAALITALDAVLTGALHLDGFADMADGFGGGRTKDDVLRIMRDHAIGSYGGVALVVALLLKTACVSDLLAARQALYPLFIIPMLSRWGMVLMSRSAPYARVTTEGERIGTGALTKSFSRSDLVIATLFCAPLPFVFGWKRTLACWLVVAAMTAVISRICKYRIGGITGDTVGANLVLSEIAQFLLADFFI
ncbi:MAG: adenosylcobinamide-GDP ribazoletransferase [Acidobacteriaceae bacterium]|nr:adenosylcobinamide-GDP ribazoletransferase [Acidobacteriaceae bacterium]